MSGERNRFPEHFTFSQRYGYEPLPESMRFGHLSNDLRRELGNAVYVFLEKFFIAIIGAQALEEDYYVRSIQNLVFSRVGEDAETRGERYIRDEDKENKNYTNFHFKRDKYVKRVWGQFNKVVDIKIQMDYDKFLKSSESFFMKEKYSRVFDFLEIMFRIALEKNDWNDISKTVKTFAARIERLLRDYAAPYSLETSQPPYWFFPIASKEQGEATQQAIETVRQGRMDAAATHLRQAVEHINMGQYADSVADSIHAVESVARTIDPNHGNSLGKALNSLEDEGHLKHKALKQAFMKLYGYTSDEQGIRHALLDQSSADVGLDEAIFMFGACASFAAYLTSKHQQQTKI